MKSPTLITFAQTIFTLLLFLIGILILGIALYPSLLFIFWVWAKVASLTIPLKIFILSLSLVFAYFLFGVILIFVVSFFHAILPIRQREGEFPISSPEILKWMFVNALFLAVKVTFMDFILLTPFCPFFYQMMGAKIGANVQINSKNVADIALLEIGDNAVIGGNATVICHSFEKNGLHLKKVKIGRGVIIGLNSVIFPGAEIGEKAVIAAGAIVPKGTKIEAGAVYFGPKEKS